MLRTIYYENSNDILSLDLPEDILVVCPSPVLTDAFREVINSKYEVITIAKWISDIKLKSDQKKVSKSELMIRVASAWRNYFPEASLELFTNSFEIFTEIRSFTLDLEMALGLISDLDNDLIQSVKIFWAVLVADQLIDEHLSYSLKKEIEANRPVLFLGFKHLSSVQIDLLKHISESQQVFIYFSKAVKLESINSDWINWLDVESDKALPLQLDEEIKEINYYEYSSKKLNLYFEKSLENEKFNLISHFDSQKKMTTIQELVVSEFNFKSPIDIFTVEKIKLNTEFEPLKKMNIAEVLTRINDSKKKSIKEANYLALKVLMLFEESLLLYQQYHEEYTLFVHRLIMNVVDLNTPRNYFVSGDSPKLSKVVSFDELKFSRENDKIALVLSKDGSPFNVKENKYSELIIEKLKAVGPIKRGGLEFSMLKNDFFELLALRNVTMFIEHGMFEIDLGIKEIQKRFTLNRIDVELKNRKKIKDPLDVLIHKNNKISERYSASRLQTYFDCPRKYYFNYIDKIDITPEQKSNIGPDEKGTLEHAIIKDYFETEESLNLDSLKKMTKERIISHLEKNKRMIEEKEFNEVFFEIVEYTYNALVLMFEIRDSKNPLSIKFEFSLPRNDWKMTGSIDCLVEYQDSFEIYDFKRSESSTGHKSDLERFEKLQLWIYALVMNRSKKVLRIGYINISDTTKNIFLNINDELPLFNSKLEELIHKVENEKDFLAIPFHETVCRYCNVNKICPKDVV